MVAGRLGASQSREPWSVVEAKERIKSLKGKVQEAAAAIPWSDAYETITCAWLSLTTLAGLLLNAAFGWWWADPAAALVLVPLIVKEGLEGWRGEHCGCH